MTTAFVVTLLVGMGLGVALGVPMGRFFERVRPSRKEDDERGAKRKPKKR